MIMNFFLSSFFFFPITVSRSLCTISQYRTIVHPRRRGSRILVPIFPFAITIDHTEQIYIYIYLSRSISQTSLTRTSDLIGLISVFGCLKLHDKNNDKLSPHDISNTGSNRNLTLLPPFDSTSSIKIFIIIKKKKNLFKS